MIKYGSNIEHVQYIRKYICMLQIRGDIKYSQFKRGYTGIESRKRKFFNIKYQKIGRNKLNKVTFVSLI